MNDCRCARSRCCFSIMPAASASCGCALALEARVVAGVALELLRVDVHDDVHDAVEEVAVVRDDDQRAGVALAASPRARSSRRGRGGWSARRAAAGRTGTSAPARGSGACASRRRSSPPARSICSCEKPRPVQELLARASARCRRPRRRARRAARRCACRRRRPRRLAASSASSLAQRRVAVDHVVERRRGRARASPARRARSRQRAGKSTSPWSACSSPRSSANRLDLPEPFGADQADLVARD